MAGQIGGRERCELIGDVAPFVQEAALSGFERLRVNQLIQQRVREAGEAFVAFGPPHVERLLELANLAVRLGAFGLHHLPDLPQLPVIADEELEILLHDVVETFFTETRAATGRALAAIIDMTLMAFADQVMVAGDTGDAAAEQIVVLEHS